MTQIRISKTLSANDTGETGAHQAGLHIPKERRLLSFFPSLDASEHNPRSHLRFCDENGRQWDFAFIYYNNRQFGGTRNEYRLTRMTKYIREAGLVSGDEVQMLWSPEGGYSISYRRKTEPVTVNPDTGRTILRLGSGWRVIDI